MWKQLPMLPDGLPSIWAALDAPSALAASPFDTSSFGEWVAHGNPWHLQAYGKPCSYEALIFGDNICCKVVSWPVIAGSRKLGDRQHATLLMDFQWCVRLPFSLY